jgi:hypothetical protein
MFIGKFVISVTLATSCPTFRKVTVSDAELIGDCLKKDPSTSSRQVYSELKAAGAQFSLSTTKRAIEVD